MILWVFSLLWGGGGRGWEVGTVHIKPVQNTSITCGPEFLLVLLQHPCLPLRPQLRKTAEETTIYTITIKARTKCANHYISCYRSCRRTQLNGFLWVYFFTCIGWCFFMHHFLYITFYAQATRTASILATANNYWCAHKHYNQIAIIETISCQHASVNLFYLHLAIYPSLPAIGLVCDAD